ncbi:MAG: hypothetical protein ACFFDN_45390, partial [Candidatus Hodarchaeota archaeon]
IFENDYYPRIYYDHYIDEIFLTINYKHPDPIYSDLRVKIDDKDPWIAVSNIPIDIDMSGWMAGDNHNFQFKAFNTTYDGILHLNLKSVLSLSNFTLSASNARYYMETANSEYGTWNITYNNTFSYSKLTQLNNTPLFNLSDYSISYVNLPAFDNESSNSNNWDIFSALSPDLADMSQNIYRFNYMGDDFNQSARINHAFSKGNWTLLGRQFNYIVDGIFNATEYDNNIPIICRNSTLKYNFSLKADLFNNYKGYYNISILNSSGHIQNSFPKYYASTETDKYLNGTIDIPDYVLLGRYYFLINWNDTNNIQGKTLRFGSRIKPFKVVNATIADFIHRNLTAKPGQIANFSLYYREKSLKWGLNGSSIYIYENSTGSFKPWGETWTGTYQVDEEDITYLGDGNYSIQLDTSGTENKTYTLLFQISKSYHQSQNLTTDLDIISTKLLNISITRGAYYDSPSNSYIIESSNIPYVNDTINSIIQVNLTDEISHNPIEGGVVVGTFEGIDSHFEAMEIGNGLYNLTLDTTGLNASTKSGNDYVDNETLFIYYSAYDYGTRDINVTAYVDKIPTEINLQDIDPCYINGEISVLASMFKIIDSEHPDLHNHGNLTYYIYNGTTHYKNGSLDFLTNGVYQKDASLYGLEAGDYKIYVNGTSFNCEKAQSNSVNFTILPKEATALNITLPDYIRVLKKFQIKTSLSYSKNDSSIPDQTITLNVTLEGEQSFLINTITDSNGESVYEHIVAPEDENKKITITAKYNGQEKVGESQDKVEKTIVGKIPATLEIFGHPNNSARVGYSAEYKAKLNIKDSSENPQNRIIFFTAYYENEVSYPIIIQQLFTNENGECNYTIPEISGGNDNLTVYFEYLGSTTVAYNFTHRTDTILGKWDCYFTHTPLPDIIRYGQDLTFDLAFHCQNSSISLEGLPVVFNIKYENNNLDYTKYIDENDDLLFVYTLADSFEGNLQVNIYFSGTNKINGYSKYFNLVISNK